MCRIDFFNVVLVQFLKKKNSDLVWNDIGSIQFKNTWFGSDIVFLYYVCNSLVVNLQPM